MECANPTNNDNCKKVIKTPRYTPWKDNVIKQGANYYE